MLGLLSRGRPLRWSRQYPLGCRSFTFKAIYSSSFPATLLYYSPRGGSRLFDHKDLDARPDDLWEEGVGVGKGGYVFPGLEGGDISNGPVMYPNTFMMQELIRRYVDEATDRKYEGKKVDESFVYTIPKGTPIPSQLVLINEYISRFSLQPSRGTKLQEFNLLLDEFYARHAQKLNAGDWLDGNPYHKAIPDDMDTIWTAQ